jgi:hypothetical protein
LTFGDQGVICLARLDYLTSLEAKRNFGVEHSIGLGYFKNYGDLTVALIGSVVRSGFDATKPDSLDTNGNLGPDGQQALLHVKSHYDLYRIGLEVTY